MTPFSGPGFRQFPISFCRRVSHFEVSHRQVAHFCFCLVRIKMLLLIWGRSISGCPPSLGPKWPKCYTKTVAAQYRSTGCRRARNHPNGYQNCWCTKIASFESPPNLPCRKPSVLIPFFRCQRTTQTGTKAAGAPKLRGLKVPRTCHLENHRF